jgi:hypothetical protein
MENHGLDGDDLTGCVASFTSGNSDGSAPYDFWWAVLWA